MSPEGDKNVVKDKKKKVAVSFKRLMAALIIIAVLGIVFIGWSFYAAVYKWRSPAAKELEIAPGSSVQTIAALLAESEVIRTPQIFTAYVRLRGLSGKLKAGEYEFPAGMTAAEVLRKLVKGEVKKYHLQIIEGWSIKDVLKYLSENPVIEDQAIVTAFEQLVEDRPFIESLGIKDANTLEGYLFPDTYEILRPKNAEDLIKRMVARFKEIYSPEVEAIAKKANLSQKEVLTLASIVEKETGKADERPVIASVFFNRLKQNMPLQSDPTVIYGIEDFDGNLRRRDLENTSNPYNTYVKLGLPPGPICNPGLASIMAVLHPADTEYLYFVSKNDGSHVFSETLEEHNRNVQRYQLGRDVGPEVTRGEEVVPPPGVSAIPPLVAPRPSTVTKTAPAPKAIPAPAIRPITEAPATAAVPKAVAPTPSTAAGEPTTPSTGVPPAGPSQTPLPPITSTAPAPTTPSAPVPKLGEVAPPAAPTPSQPAASAEPTPKPPAEVAPKPPAPEEQATAPEAAEETSAP